MNGASHSSHDNTFVGEDEMGDDRTMVFGEGVVFGVGVIDPFC